MKDRFFRYSKPVDRLHEGPLALTSTLMRSVWPTEVMPHMAFAGTFD